MSVSKEKIKELLGQGLGPNVVADAVGCDHSYISQLMADRTFLEEVTALRMLALTADTQRDSNINRIEDKIIEKLEEVVDMGAIRKPSDILNVFRAVNMAKRRGVSASTVNFTQNTVIALQLPTRVSQQLTINQKGEVVGVGEQTLVTKPTHQLLKELSERYKDDKYKQVSGRLLGAVEGNRSDGTE